MSFSLPSQFIQSLQQVPGFDDEAFIKAHEAKPAVSIRFQPNKSSVLQMQSLVNHLLLPTADPVPWCEHAYYLQERPSFTFDPLFHAGLYYVQEASSMFLWEVLKQTIGNDTKDKKVLDLCAAPGGKSTLLSSYFKDGWVVANEVIKSRATILAENVTKWGNDNIVVTNNDPAHFQKLEGFFDVMVIDAPCSGSGLFRKDKEAIQEWSEEAVNLCSLRQQRIVADAYSCLKQDGILIYSTCSYSTEEDENLLDWIIERFQLSAIRIQTEEKWNIVETQSARHHAYGYRFYPDKARGEGLFIAALVKKEGTVSSFPSQSLPVMNKKEKELWMPWINDTHEPVLIKQNQFTIALPRLMHSHLNTLQKALYIKQAGITLGEIKGKDVIPHQALAVSSLVNESVNFVAFNREQAIQFLQKKEISIDAATLPKGWQLLRYCEIGLGWLKVLPNRINNYYPAEWRILKN